MRKQWGLWSVVFIFLIFGFGSQVRAAEIKLQGKEPCDLLLTGTIEKGDKEKIIAAVRAARKRGYVTGLPKTVLCLDSTGGAYSEALLIVEHFREAGGLTTYVDANATCYSACAVVFMGGTSIHNTRHWQGPEPERTLHVMGKLGFHAPYLTRDTDKAEYVIQAYTEGVQAIAKLAQLKIINSDLLVEMLLRGRDEIFMIDTVDKAGRWGFDLAGTQAQFAVPQMRGQTVLTELSAYIGCNNLYGWRMNDYSVYRRDISSRCDKPLRAINNKDCWEKQVLREGGVETSVEYKIRMEGYYGRTCAIRLSTTHNPEPLSLAWFRENDDENFDQSVKFWHLLPPETPLSKIPDLVK